MASAFKPYLKRTCENWIGPACRKQERIHAWD